MTRRLPNLNQLRAFEAAARRGSFKDAADELHVTHAAVSHQIKALEADLGLQLFHRRTRKVELTDQARDFAARLSAAFSEIAAASEAVTAGGLTGEIRVTMAPYFANRCILPYLGAFHEAHPGLIVSPEMSSGVVDLRGSDCDAAVRYGGGSWSGMTAIQIYEDRVSPVAAPTLAAAEDLPLAPERIARLTLGAVGDTASEWLDWFEAAGCRLNAPPAMVEYSNRARVADMAISGAGVGLLDRHLVAADIRDGRLARLNPLAIRSAKSMYVVFPETGYPDPRVLAFAQWLRDRFASVEAELAAR